MAKTIKGNEIIEDNHLANAIRDAKALREEYDKLDKSTKALAADTKKLTASITGNTAAEIQKLNKAILDSTNVRISSINIDKKKAELLEKEAKLTAALERVEQQKAKTEKERLSLSDKITAQQEKKAKATQREANEAKKLNSVYEQNKKKLNDLAKALKELESRNRGNGKVAQGLRKEYDSLYKSVFNAEKSVNQFQREVGNYPKVVGLAANSIRNLAASFGLVVGGAAVLKDVFNIVSQSEDAFASLSAITGLTGEKFDVFKVAIMGVAEELNVSGTEVASAAEKIASAQPKLLENADALAAVTKEAITLNKAIKGDLTETSMALVGVMNQFSLEADQASRIINVLAAGSQAGAADVNQINESMTKFGTTAKLLNISVEESVGAIETLGEKAIFGSEAGTALRNILLKMSSIDVLPEKALKQLEAYGVNTNIVKDTTLSFEDRLRELSKVAGDSTAIMQIFGTENATAATVLLNSVDTYSKMTDAVTGTSVAQEQAAINSDTLTAVIQELRAAWENLVIKWSEGTDVAVGLKSILRFLADNLETIVNVVIRAVSAWGAYRIGLMAWNKEGTGVIQVLGKMVKQIPMAISGFKGLGQAIKSVGLGGWMAILTVVVPLLIDMGKAIGEMVNKTTALDRVQEKYNEKLTEERVEMDKLRFAIETTTHGSEDRLAVLKKIDAQYGTSLQNIEDEAVLMEELWKAYQKVNAEMEKRIMQQVLEEELTNLLKAKREIEKSDTKSLFGGDITGGFLDDVQADIDAVKAELFALNKTASDIGKKRTGALDPRSSVTATGADAEKKKQEEDALAKLRRENAEELIALENQLLQSGLDKELVDQRIFETRLLQYNEEFEMIDRLNYGSVEYNKTLNERLKLTQENVKLLNKPEIKKIGEKQGSGSSYMNPFFDALAEQQAEAERIALEERKKLAQESIDLMKKVTDALAEEIDKRIEIEKSGLEDSQNQIDYLKGLAAQGNVDAANSIKAETIAMADQKLEIEELEKKKRNLLLITTGLEAVSQKINSGDSNAFKNTSSDIASFFASLPKFFDGTETTVADALGKPHLNTSKDAYLARLHGTEMVLNESKVKQLQSVGLGTTSDVANAAISHANGILNSRSVNGGESVLVNELRDVKNAIKGIDIPEHQFRFDEQSKMAIEQIKTHNKIVKNHYKTGGLFS